jgi:uncharacterized protein YwgA
LFWPVLAMMREISERLRHNRHMSEKNAVLLFALAAAPEHSLTPVQVQKIAFLVGQEAKRLAPKPFYKFTPYDYGPFSPAVYNDLSKYAQDGLVAVDRPPGARVRRYRLTSEGLEHLQSTDAEMSPLADYVSQATQWVTSLSFTELVSAIYARYPSYKKNSVFVE